VVIVIATSPRLSLVDAAAVPVVVADAFPVAAAVVLLELPAPDPPAPPGEGEDGEGDEGDEGEDDEGEGEVPLPPLVLADVVEAVLVFDVTTVETVVLDPGESAVVGAREVDVSLPVAPDVAPPVEARDVEVSLVVFAEPIAAEEATNTQKRRFRELIAPMTRLHGSPPSAQFALLIHKQLYTQAFQTTMNIPTAGTATPTTTTTTTTTITRTRR
jgi:hypothetical protein